MILLYALARPISSSLSPASANNTSSESVTGECLDINGCRTTTGIIWSCLSVIFICTWVAIHPDIPYVEKYDTKKRKWSGRRWHPAVLIYQNVELMVIALLAPEIMILWAMRQQKQAKIIGEIFKKYGWGMSHGFFVIMGGFALYDGDRFCGYLWDRNRKEKVRFRIMRVLDGREAKFSPDIQNYIARVEKMNESNETTSDMSAPSSGENAAAEESQETKPSCTSSEPDNLLEFLLEKCYINITEDEIKDRSHADVITKSIAVIQTVWFIMQVIARAVEGLAITELEIVTVGFAILNFGTYFLWWHKPLRVRHPVKVYWRHRERSQQEDTDGGKAGIWSSFWEAGGAIVEYLSCPFVSPDTTLVQRVILLPLWIPWHISSVCSSILEDLHNECLAIPIFSRLHNNPPHIYMSVYGISALFGAIHCIPWAFQFPTHTEQLLWHISATAVAAAPIAMGSLHVYRKRLFQHIPRWLDKVLKIFRIIFPIAYVVFRITLIVIAFTALRDLSPSAYQTVEWTTFIPHIG